MKPPDKRASPTPKKATAAETDSAGANQGKGAVRFRQHGERAQLRLAGPCESCGSCSPKRRGQRHGCFFFGVTPSGGLAYVRISRSSGNAAIDRFWPAFERPRRSRCHRPAHRRLSFVFQPRFSFANKVPSLLVARQGAMLFHPVTFISAKCGHSPVDAKGHQLMSARH